MWIDLLSSVWTWGAAFVCMGLAVAATLHAVLRKRDIRAVIGWVGLIVLAPFVGALAYFWLGVNRIKRKARSLANSDMRTAVERHTLAEQDADFSKEQEAKYPNLWDLATLGTTLTGKPVLSGNEIVPLIDGDEAYPAMLAAIDGAARSVSLLSYIFDHDRVGEAFHASLLRAQERGVSVRVLIDYVGSRYSKPSMVDVLKKSGIQVAAFLPTRSLGVLQYANLRNHRKILVVDGCIGFTGGTNIREGHQLDLKPGFPVQCVHFRFKGPVVAHLQEAFAEDWEFTTGKALTGDLWFPEIETVGESWARGIPDGPDGDFEVLLHTLLGAISAAKKSILVVTPYFLPDSSVIHALNVAAMKGVEVSILVPSKNNLPMVEWASTAQFHQLLEKGCKIYLNPPPFDHTKLMVVDDLWSLVGSTNWDPRSLRLNFEYNVECYSKDLAESLSKSIRAKIDNAHCVSMAELLSLPLVIRVRNGLSRLLTPYL